MSKKTPVEVHVIGRATPGNLPVVLSGVIVAIQEAPDSKKSVCEEKTDALGIATFELDEGEYIARVTLSPAQSTTAYPTYAPVIQELKKFKAAGAAKCPVELEVALPQDSFKLIISDGKGWSDNLASTSTVSYGKNYYLEVQWTEDHFIGGLKPYIEVRGAHAQPGSSRQGMHSVLVQGNQAGQVQTYVSFGGVEGRFERSATPTRSLQVPFSEPQTIEGGLSVSMRRTASRPTGDVGLWVTIRSGTDALSFDRYYDYMNWLFCDDTHPPLAETGQLRNEFTKVARRGLPFTDTDAYRNIKAATEAFVMANCGVIPKFTDLDSEYVMNQVVFPAHRGTLDRLFERYQVPLDGARDATTLPYLAFIRSKLADNRIKDKDIGDVSFPRDVPRNGRVDAEADAEACYGLLRQKITRPCLLELIWSYWQEEGMLVQTMNAIARRFQNMRAPSGNDPLANLEIDPLRPLNNVFWGYIQDEQHRLSVVRRNYEYDHHYGLRLAGKAVRDMRTADSRSKFLEAFHTLLSIVSGFYKRDDDTTIVADGFPVLNALKEAHIILSQGAHNQFGDLPSTARIEMLMQQWILARPEFREFLPTRIMVAYPEPWMDRVDAMKKLQGWTDTSVLHFRNLAIFGEQVLLSIRYGAWADVNDPAQAANWARYWRPEIQGYLHAYRSVTSVDLSVDVTNARIDATLPSVHLVQRLTEQRRLVAS
jgi:hypothetical protein